MVETKSVNFGDFVGCVEFFTVDETVKRTTQEHVVRRDLYMADDRAPGGMTLVRRGDLFKANLFSLPRRYMRLS